MATAFRSLILGLAATFAALGTVSGGDAQSLVDALVMDSQRHQIQRKPAADDALFQAEQYASLVASDVSTYARRAATGRRRACCVRNR
jgi:hypothetical protein